MEENRNNFYKINEILQHKYYQIPQELFSNTYYKDNLSLESKILYAFILDRLTLSQKNNWVADDGTVYLIFTREEASDKLCLSNKPIIRAFKQLVDIGLLAEKRQGLGKPNIIFVGKIQHSILNIEMEKLHSLKCQKSISEDGKFTSLDIEKIHTINTNNNNTNKDSLILSNQHTHEISCEYENLFKQNIEYDILIQDEKNRSLIENITNIAIETINSKKNIIYVNKEEKPKEIVKSQLLKLNSEHIQYVINCLNQNTNDIRNVKSYILTCLYNSINTIHLDTTLAVSKMMNS